jgi:Zn-dependent protease with chaperone function
MTAARSRRPDPFAFPSDTTFRFVLLVVAALGASLFLYRGVYTGFIADSRADLATYVECYRDSKLGEQSFQAYGELGERSRAYAGCVAPTQRTEARWVLGGLGLLVVVTIAIYLLIPAARIWRRRLRPLTREDAPEVVDELAVLVRDAGLSKAPVFVWNPLSASSSGVAFGRRGRYVVALGGGLVMTYHSDRDAFRAVLRHELAHLRNGDVDRTYLAIASWWAFLVAALAPFAVSLVDEPADYIAAVLWRAAVLAALVYVLRNGVLRARELYADARASSWDGPSGALARVIQALPSPERRWGRGLGVHPDPALRARALDDPQPLFSIGLAESLGTGIVATVAYANVIALLTGFVTDGLELRWLAALIFAPLAVGVVGLGVWRATYASRFGGKTAPSGISLGLCLGAGFLLGQSLSFDRAISGPADKALGLAGFTPLWTLLVLVSIALFTRWLVVAASAWLPAGITARPRRFLSLAGLVAAGGALAVWMGWLFFLRETTPVFKIAEEEASATRDAVAAIAWVPPEQIWLAVWHPLAVYFALDRFTLALVLALCAVPFGAWLVYRGRDVLRPLPALAIGGSGGAVYLALVLVLRLGIHASVSSERGATEQFRLGFYTWQVALAFGVMCAVAAAVAAWIRPFGAVHGFLAAFVTGAIGACTIVGGIQLATCVDAFSITSAGSCGWVVDSTFTWQVFRQVAVQGLIYALPAAILGSVVAGGIRRLREPRLAVAGAAG